MMKLTLLIGRRLFTRPFSLTSSSSPTIRNFSGLAASWIATAKPEFLSHERKLDSTDTLYRKISLVRPESSITPFLDEWEKEGHYVNKQVLVYNAKRLRKRGRFHHALEVLHWMGNKDSMPLSARDIAIQLDLISKLHGCEQAEKIFNCLPKELKNYQTYGALLRCYVSEMLVDKAEAMMQEMRDLGVFKTYLNYSAALSLYYKLGNIAKVHDLEHEMDQLDIVPDIIIYSILLNAYGSESDVDGMNKIVEKAESDCRVNLDSTFYFNAAKFYINVGLVDKGVGYLKKAEEFRTSINNRGLRFSHLLTLYARAGMKEEVLRIWEECKNRKLFNTDYFCIMDSLLKFKNFEAAEQVLEEYVESTDLSLFNMRIPNRLIGGYCRNGLVEKAENVIQRKILSKGLQPESFAWYYLAQAYIDKNRMMEAVEALKSAALVCTLRWKPSLESLVSCFSYLIAEKDKESFEELAGLLKSKGFVSEELHGKLLELALDGKQVKDALEEELDAESEEEKNTCDLTLLIGRRLFSRPFPLTSSSPAIRSFSGLAASWIATAKPEFLSHERKLDSSDTLYRKISSVRLESSITPFLDEWKKEGHYVNKQILVSNAKRLRKSGHFRHALEVMQWMANKESMPLSAGDIAIELDLTSKLHGYKQAEKIFNRLPKELKTHQTYGALLSCYASDMLVDKAEAMMQEMKDLGFFKTNLCYGTMLSLYSKLGNIAKLHDLEHEMDRLGIVLDEFVYCILLIAYGSESDVDGLNKIVEKAESDCRVSLNSTFYLNAANLYFKVGLVDKGVGYLKKAEEFPASMNNRGLRFCHLLTLYTRAGMKEEVLRIWEKCKNRKLFSADYLCMMDSLLKFKDFEAAEKVLEEYEESTGSSFFNMRIPNRLIGGYCRNGLVEKGENVIHRKILPKGLQPESFAWYYLALAYLEKNQMLEAVEAMKSAALICTLSWKPSLESLVSCFSYLIAEKDMESFEELAGLLKSKGFVSEELHGKLMELALDGKQVKDVLEEEFGAGDAEPEEEENTCE